jgi:glycosyltransferase involved in cell wall biosynthesis
MKLSIIIPTYNEQNTIRKILEYVQSVDYPVEHEVIIVDDASIDRTYEKEYLLRLRNAGKEHNIKLFRNRMNRGKGFSIRKGIKRASGDMIVIQDADMEYDPADIPKLLEPLMKGEAEVVYGSRFLENNWPEGMAVPNWLANRLLTWLANVLFGLSITDEATCYKVFNAELLKSLPLRANRFNFCPEVTGMLGRMGKSITELPVSYRARSMEEGKKIRAHDLIFAVLMLVWQRIRPVRR